MNYLIKNVHHVRVEFYLLILVKFINIKKKIDGWDVKKNTKEIYFLEKNFIFKNFVNSQNFINKVGEISENENHHPDISFGWGYAKIVITTHAIEGLSENDFILAAKIDQIFNV